MRLNKTTILLHYFLLSLILFSPKWIYSFYTFDEILNLKFIIDSDLDSLVYFPFIVDLSELNFFGTNNYNSQKNIIFPIGSVIFHSFVFKFFGIGSLVLMELISIFFFLLILSKIFNFFINNELFCLLITLIIFSIHSSLFLIEFQYSYLIDLTNFFFNLRFPRPLITNIFYFYFLYLIISFSEYDFFLSKKNALLISIILALSFMSFHNIFYYEIILLISLFCIFYKQIFQKSLGFLKFLTYTILLFVIFDYFFINLYVNAEPDYYNRLGILENTNDIKIYLLKHYLIKFFDLRLILLIILFIFFLFVLKKESEKKITLIKVFGFINLISIFIFIILSPKIHHLYHYVSTFILNFLIINIILFLYIAKPLINKIKYIYYYFFIFLFATLYNVGYLFYQKDFRSIEKINDRNDLNLIVTKLEDEKLIENLKKDLMIFDGTILNYLKFEGKKNFYPIGGFYTPNTNIEQENDLIQSLKFLGFSKEMFENFIKNELQIKKFQNKELQTYFVHRYQANKLTTFNKSKNFTSNELNYILNSGPSFTHQSIIPLDELSRLSDKFHNYELKKEFRPDLILINKTKKFKNLEFKNNDYCKLHESNLRLVYVKKFKNCL